MSPQEQAAEIERNYRNLFNAVADAIVTVDPDSGLILDANEVAQTMYGRGLEELRGMPMSALSAEPELTAASVRELTVLDRVNVTRTHLRKDGTTFFAEVHASAFEHGGRRTVIAAIRDATERVAAQAQLAESELRFRQMAASISQVFWMTDPAKRQVMYISPGYETIWGRSSEELYRDPRGWLEAILPEDRERILIAVMNQVSGQYDETYRIRRADGAIRWIRDRAFPVKDEAGRVIRIAGVAQDITPQHLAEEALRENKAFLEQAQQVANMGSWVYDVQAATVLWSDECCRLFGAAPGGPRPLSEFNRILHPDDRDACAVQTESAIASAKGYSSEYRIVRPDGEVRWIVARAAIERDGAGRAVRMVGVVRDVTEEKENAERLKATERLLSQAQKMEAVGRLAGGVAHDFNNILTAILGLTELSIASLPEESPIRADLGEVRLSSLRAANLTQQLLAFSRRQMIVPTVFTLDDRVLGVMKMLRRIIGEDVELRVNPAAGGVRVLVDAIQLEQLIMNLAVNARDAMPEGGRITIDTARVTLEGASAEERDLPPGVYASVRVSDTGTGISDAVKSHLFEPFFTTKELGKGTGLGLATCYGIAKQNHGAIYCESEPGHGAAFTVLLPECVTPADERTDGPDNAGVRGGTERVLVVEDEVQVRRLTARMLTGLGYDVVQASNGQEALLALSADTARSIRLIVTDMIMPGIGGRKMAELAAEFRPDVSVLFTSGYTDDMIGAHDTFQPGLNFLIKPFTARAFGDQVRRMLDARSDQAS